MCNDEERVGRLVDSLELITARMLEITTANNQLATSQTPELRRLFDTWVSCMSEEMRRVVEREHTVDLNKLSGELGLAPTSIASLLLTLDRRGDISITHITAEPGDGKNRELCDCLNA